MHFPQGRGCGMCQAVFQFQECLQASSTTQHNPGGSVCASKCCFWQLDNSGHKWPAGHVAEQLWGFGSSSTVTEISSSTPAGIEATAALLASTGEIFGLCCSNQAKVWGELSARCDGVCQSRDGFQTQERQGKGAKHSVMCKHYMYSVFIWALTVLVHSLPASRRNR